jgi:hypothetical protein
MELATFRSAADADAAALSPRSTAALQPRMVKDEHGTRFVLPGETLSARPNHS